MLYTLNSSADSISVPDRFTNDGGLAPVTTVSGLGRERAWVDLRLTRITRVRKRPAERRPLPARVTGRGSRGEG